MRFYLTLTLLLAVVWSFQAELAFAAPRLDPKFIRCDGQRPLAAKQLNNFLAEAGRSVAKVDSFSGRFEQLSFVASLESEERSSGSLKLARPDRIALHYESPEEQHFVVSDGVITMYQPLEQQAIFDSFDATLATDLPIKFLLEGEGLERAFMAKAGCERDGGLIVLELESKELPPSSEDRSRVFLALGAVSESARPVLGVRVLDAGGNSTSIALSEIRSGESFSPADFKLKLPAGVDMIDRRVQRGENSPIRE